MVVAFDSAVVLPACLEALAREDVASLVVNNGSADRSAEVAEAYGAQVLGLPRNYGYGRANNRGIQAASTSFVLICNPDVVLDPGSFAALLTAAERYPDAGLYAPRLVEPDGRVFYQTRSLLAPVSARAPGAPEADACAPFLSGACFLIRRELLLDLGGFDPNIFLFYEDDDLCRRIADRGLAMVYVHDAAARHARGGSSARGPGRVYASRWHQAWSKAYVARKHGLPNPAPAMLARNLAKLGLARLSADRALIERYAGSVAGAYAFLHGRTALEREGLDKAS